MTSGSGGALATAARADSLRPLHWAPAATNTPASGISALALEAGSDRGSLEKALSLLDEARALAPGLVGIDDEIARVRALLAAD